MLSVVAVLSAPFVYGVLCVPGNWLVVTLFPQHFDERWVTRRPRLLVLLLAMTVVYAGASGFVGAWIAPSAVMGHAAAMCVLQLAVGLAVQKAYWSELPLWYHLGFLALLAAGTFIGAGLRVITM